MATPNADEKCPICRVAGLEPDDSWQCLPCAHWVHQYCLNAFRECKKTTIEKTPCPTCKLTPEDLQRSSVALLEGPLIPSGTPAAPSESEQVVVASDEEEALQGPLDLVSN